MVSRGHKYHDVVYVYPFALVNQLIKAASANDKVELIHNTFALNVALTNAIDIAFGGGKGKILSTWLDSMDADKVMAPNKKSEPDPETTINMLASVFPTVVRKRRREPKNG